MLLRRLRRFLVSRRELTILLAAPYRKYCLGILTAGADADERSVTEVVRQPTSGYMHRV